MRAGRGAGRAGRRGWWGRGSSAVEYVHRVSRAGDAQLHSHVVIGQHDSRRWALDHAGRSGAVRESQDRVGAVSRRAAGGDDRRLGVRVGAGGAGQAGGGDQRRPRAVLRDQSRRHQEIVERMADRGESSPRAAQAAALDTRKAKDYDVDRRDIALELRTRIAEKGLGPAELAAVVDRQRPERPANGRAGAHVRRLLGPGRDDRAPVDVLAPRRHPAVGRRPPPGRIGRANRAAHRPVAGPAGDRRLEPARATPGGLADQLPLSWPTAAASCATPPATLLATEQALLGDRGPAPSRRRGHRSDRDRQAGADRAPDADRPSRRRWCGS